MAYAERMKRVTLVAPKQYMERVISTLYELGAYHIEEHQKTEQLDISRPLESGEKTAGLLVKLRAIIAQLKIEEKKEKTRAGKQEKSKQLAFRDYPAIEKKIISLAHDVFQQAEIIKNAEQQIQELTGKLQPLQLAKQLQLPLEALRHSKTLTCAVGFADSLERIRQQLEAVTRRYELRSVQEKQRLLIVVFFEQKEKERMLQALHGGGFIEVHFTPADHSEGWTVEKLLRQVSKAQEECHAAEQRLLKLKREQESFVLEHERILSEESIKAEVPLKFAATQKTFMITGWVPKKKVSFLGQELNTITNSKVHIAIEEPEEEENVPINLKNLKPVQPFEFLTRLYELPSYHEIDPSILIFFTFPLFFGIMMGDVGYGLVTLLLFMVLKRKIHAGKALFTILIFASILSIGFGFVFGEYFGFENVSAETGERLCSMGICLPEKVIEEHGETRTVAVFPHLLNRVHDEAEVFGYTVPSILVIGAIIGFIHLNLGLLIGFVNTLHHGLAHAFLEKISWMIMEAGLILIVLSSTKMISMSILIGIAVLVAGIVCIYLGEGVRGLVELPALLSNTLSYMRLGAVGLAGVGLAIVINEKLAIPMIEKGGIFILFGVLIFLIGHIINIGLSVMGPFLHALRLHYVEFFSKFYHGGGIEYTPFGAAAKQGGGG